MAGTFTNTGFVTVAGALAIDAGSIVNEQRTARDTALRIFKSKGKTARTWCSTSCKRAARSPRAACA